MDQQFLINLLVQIAVIGALATALMIAFAGLTVVERKLLGRFTMRYGPNRVGKYGTLQIVADGLKMFFKEEVIPGHVDRLVYLLAPGLALVPALMAFAVVPITSQAFTLPFQIFGTTITIEPWIAADINVGLLYILAIGSLGTYGVILGGWSSNNKYSLLGGLRTSAQMLSYELPMGMALLSAVLITGTLQMTGLVEFQSHWAGFRWLILFQPLAFIIFFICSLAEAGRSPFDLPETENELIAGFSTEYGGMKFGIFFGAEYVHMIVASFIMATIFLGGWLGPFATQVPFLGIIYLLLKVAFLIFMMIWVRTSVPRVRFDKLMKFCWKFLLPLSIANAVVTALVVAILFF